MADRSPNLIDNVTPSGALAYDERQAPTAAQSPFGPMRKREHPPVKVPGQRQPSDSNAPRPKPPTSQFNPDTIEVAEQVASWWNHAAAFANGDAWDQHAAANAFGGAA